MNTKQRNRLKRKMQAYNASKAATNAPIDAKTESATGRVVQRDAIR